MVRVVDKIQSPMVFADHLSCNAHGSTTTLVCSYDPLTRTVIWMGMLGPDPNASDAASADNEITITFDTMVLKPNVSLVNNVADAYWDENGDGMVGPGDPNVDNNTPAIASATVRRPPIRKNEKGKGNNGEKGDLLSPGQGLTSAPGSMEAAWPAVAVVPAGVPHVGLLGWHRASEISWLGWWRRFGWVPGRDG